MKPYLLLLGGLICAAGPSLFASGIDASATFTDSMISPGEYQYNLTLDDIGTTTIGTYWLSWRPGDNFMAVSPTSIDSPTGWQEIITSGGPSGGFAIQWTATTSGNDLASGDSLVGFNFDSSLTPAEFESPSSGSPSDLVDSAFVSVSKFRYPCSSVFICGQCKCAIAARYFSFQLPAGRENIPAARLAHEARHGSPDDFLKRAHALRIGRLKSDPRSWIQRDQIHLRVQMSQQLYHPPRVCVGIVHAFEQHIFERQLFPRAQRISLASRQQILQRILARDRHQLPPLLFRGRVQRNRQLRAAPARVPARRSSERCRLSKA
jgi:hypothetical protein